MIAPFSPGFLPKLETLRLRARRRFLGRRRGAHASPRRGTSLEFAEFRDYAPGDDPRTVDWGLYARTDRLYVKVYHEEEDLFAYLLVDGSASMAAPEEDGKYEAACRLALAIAYVVLSGDDTVRLHRMSPAGPQSTPFYLGRRRLLEAREFLDRPPAPGRLEWKAALLRSLEALRRPGKAVVLSDLLFPVEEFHAGLNVLLSARLDVLVVQTLGATEVSPPAAGAVRVEDAETGEALDVRLDERGRALYLESLDKHRREIRSVCHRAGVQYASYDTSMDLEDFVLTELPALGLFRE